jgi:hypothetical protein
MSSRKKTSGKGLETSPVAFDVRGLHKMKLLALGYELGNAGVTQLVECNLAKVDVAGSNPVSRSE